MSQSRFKIGESGSRLPSGALAPMVIGEVGFYSMSCVYILQSKISGRYYIGSTNDIERRLKEHNSGKTKSLRQARPLKIVFQKECETLQEARHLEKRLKKMKNRNIIEAIVRDQTMKLGR